MTGLQFLWILVAFGIAMSARAGSVYVESFKGIAVAETEVAAVEELVRTTVVEDLKHQLVELRANADYVIGGKLIKMGEAYSLTLFKVRGPSEVFRASLKSTTMADMDVVVRRLVRAVDSETSADDTETVKDVTQDDATQQRRRKEVLSQTVFSLGPASTTNLNIDGQTSLWNLGYNYEVDNDWDMHVSVDWLTTHRRSESDAYYAALNLGVNHYFWQKSYSPYLEGHLGYAGAVASLGCNTSSLICSSNDKAAGWMGGAGLGIRFFRTSKTNFSLLVRSSLLMDKTDLSDRYPTVTSFMVVGYFH